MNDSKSNGYFNNVLSKRIELLSFYPNRFKIIDGIKLSKSKIGYAINLTSLIHIKYSIERSYNKIDIDFTEITQILKEHWDADLVRFHTGRIRKYHDMYFLEYNLFFRKLLSFLVLFDADKTHFEILKGLIDRDKVKDGLYDFLLSYKFQERTISKEMFPAKPKNSIMDIILESDKNKCQDMIKIYLEKEWYKTYKNAGFYNTHKLPEEKYAFYGYWAFEVAAIVKIKNLDDSTFRDNQYYPKDLV